MCQVCRPCVPSVGRNGGAAGNGGAAAQRQPWPALSPADPVPRGLLTLWARAGMCVCMHVFFIPQPCIRERNLWHAPPRSGPRARQECIAGAGPHACAGECIPACQHSGQCIRACGHCMWAPTAFPLASPHVSTPWRLDQSPAHSTTLMIRLHASRQVSRTRSGRRRRAPSSHTGAPA